MPSIITAEALRLAQGQGFTEPYLWNYLDDPAGIPHPSNTYWMPMASLIAAAGMLVSGQLNFNGARLFFILLAGLIAPLTAYFALRFSKKVAFAVLAGVLAIFPGYYLAFITDTETFTLYFVLGFAVHAGGLCGLALAVRQICHRQAIIVGDHCRWNAFIQGGWHPVAGGCPGAGGLGGVRPVKQAGRALQRAGAGCWQAGRSLSLLVGYVLVMGSWYARNISLYGSLFSPGGARTLWLTNYNQTFSYPASQLTWQGWAAMSVGSHIKIWWDALVWNLKNALAVQGGVFLFLLILPGLWTLWVRKEKMVRFAM